MTTHRLLAALACLMGAGGVAAAAGAAHGGGGDGRLLAAALILLVHAAAAPGLLALRPPRIVYAVGAMEAGALLFCADMASRAFRGAALFPMAAPAGGLILIGAWLAAAALLALARRA